MKIYDSWDKSRLIEEIQKLSSRKKYGLVWEDKPEDVVEQCKNELPVLEEVFDRAIETDSLLPTNFIIEGDNYHALSVLNYTHGGKIDVIYIDPPYNTGARDWKYNNDFVDGKDSFRHSKWLSFMAKRLILAKELLTDDGVICVTIDDYEASHLWMLMDEIFGYENHLGTVVIRNNPKGRMTERKFSLVHEYGLFFGRSSASEIKKMPVDPSEKTHDYQQEKNGDWYLAVNLRKQGVDSGAYNKKGVLSHRFFPIYFDPKTDKISVTKKLPVTIEPIDSRGEKRIWRRAEDVIEKMASDGDLWVKMTKNGYQLYYKFRGGLDGNRPQTIWTEGHFSASDYGTKILNSVLGEREKFNYPKAPEAIKKSILSMSNKKNAMVLDFFAGSGTTGHAVMELNKEDGGNRRFILCTNNENRIAEEVTYPRIKNVIGGYADVEGIPANVRYFKTAFVPKSKVSDDTRRELISKSTEMLCMKESTFKKAYDNKKFKIYHNDSQATGVLFDLDALEEFKERLAQVGLRSSIYVFSLTSDAFLEDFSDLEVVHKIQPIPEGILEVYRKIFS